MSFNLIKLKKVPGKVSFDTNPRIHLYRTNKLHKPRNESLHKQNSIPLQPSKQKIRGSSTDRIKKKPIPMPSTFPDQPPPKMIRIKTAGSKMTSHNKTNAFELKKIAEDLTIIGKEIEKMVSASPPRDFLRRSITPPLPGFKITKQSFPDHELKFPRMKKIIN
jgi:hypothetical protein